MPAHRSRPWLWLLLILIVYAAIAGLYAANVPAWQAPDEPAHYNYIHELATTGQFPVLRMGDYDQAYLERLTSERFPPELPIHPVRYEAHQPPLYYLLASAVFNLTAGRLLPLRLFSVALGALLIVLTYVIVGLIYPGRPQLRLAAAAFVAFLPMHVAASASLNNDALAEVILAAILLLSIRYVKLAVLGPQPPSPWDALALGLLLGLALVTKVSAYAGIPVALAAPVIGWYENRVKSHGVPELRSTPQPQRSGRSEVEGASVRSPSETKADHVVRRDSFRSRFTFHVVLIVLPALLLALPWYVRNAQVYGNLDILGRRWHDAVVVGQLRTGELLAQAGLSGVLERFFVWSHDSFWGVFGWMGVWMDGRVYTALLAFSLAVVTGCVALIVRKVRNSGEGVSGVRMPGVNEEKATSRFTFYVSLRDAPQSRFHLWSLALLGLSALLTLGVYVSYNLIFVQPQGRYLFPALPAIGLAVAMGWQEVVWRPAAARWAGIAVLLAAGLAAVIGAVRTGINKWSVAILGGAGLVLLGWSLAIPRLREPWRTRLNALALALPLAALALLDVYALYAFILPQLS